MGSLRYRTLKDTGAGHHHACPLPLFLPQERREKGGGGDRRTGGKDKKRKLREVAERFNNIKTEEVLPCYSFIIGLQGRSNERLLIAHCSSTRILVHRCNPSPFKRALGQMRR